MLDAIRHPQQLSARAVAHGEQRAVGELLHHPVHRAREIPRAPVHHASVQRAQRLRARASDAPVVIRDDVHPLLREEAGELVVEGSLHARGGVDQHHRPVRARRRGSRAWRPAGNHRWRESSASRSGCPCLAALAQWASDVRPCPEVGRVTTPLPSPLEVECSERWCDRRLSPRRLPEPAGGLRVTSEARALLLERSRGDGEREDGQSRLQSVRQRHALCGATGSMGALHRSPVPRASPTQL